MSRFSLLIICLSFLCLSIVNIQAVSRINLTHELALTEDYHYVTTWSDSLLHFYRIDRDSTTFTLKHWTCSPAGELTIPSAIYTYTNSQPWGTYFPDQYTHIKYSMNFGNLYIQFTAGGNLYFLTVSDVVNVESDFFIDHSNMGYTLFTPNYLYYAKYVHYTQPLTIHRHNLETNVDDSLFAWPEPAVVQFLNIDNKYLLMYEPYSHNTTNSIIIDSLLTVHPTNFPSPLPYVADIQLCSSAIADNVYFATISDGIMRNSDFGYITINNFNIDFYGISYEDYQNPTVLSHSFSSIVPFGDGRFSCIDNYYYLPDSTSYKTYQYSATGMNEDYGFPNLRAYNNPSSLTRLNSRYALGIAGTVNNPRNFILVDYQLQIITDTTFTLTNAPRIEAAKPLLAGDNVYFVYGGQYPTYSRYLYILKIVDTTDATDPTQTPVTISHSAYPNPFKNDTTIKIALKQPETLKASIYNLKGQLVKDIATPAKAGLNHDLLWDGTNSNHTKASNGLYFYKVKTSSGRTITGKLLLQK